MIYAFGKFSIQGRQRGPVLFQPGEPKDQKLFGLRGLQVLFIQAVKHAEALSAEQDY